MRFVTDGAEIVAEMLTPDEIAALLSALPADVAGLRNTLWCNPLVRSLAFSAKLMDLLARVGAEPSRPVRAIFFDKNPAKNWAVPWHQDVAIAVARRIDTPGFHGWSVKDGVPHVQPPKELLARMTAVRLHLDDCDAANGALRVVPGSHRHGLLGDAECEALAGNNDVLCTVPRGGALVMRPLILHASSRATNPSHRRVLHLEYSPDDLPGGLSWYEEPVATTALT